MNSNKGLVFLVCTVVVALVLFWTLYYGLDTHFRRSRIARQIKAIASDAKQDPSNTTHVAALLHKAESNYSFEATIATSALSTVGDAANPVIHEIAALMQSPNPFVRREAALALARLGTRSAPVLPELKRKVAFGTGGDEVWFAALAIGEIGAPAIECIPLLESKLGTGARQFDDCLNEAILKLRTTKGIRPL